MKHTVRPFRDPLKKSCAKRVLLVVCVWVACAFPALHAQERGGVASPAYVDGIAAIVNRQVITLTQLDEEVRLVQQQFSQEVLPAYDMLRKQVLQRLIVQTLEQQEADRLGIRVSDAQLQQAVGRIAERNQMTVAQLQAQVTQDGIAWDAYLRTLRQEVRINQLRQQAVDSLIHITEADVDAYLRSEGQRVQEAPQTGVTRAQSAAQDTTVLGLAQILITVPEGSAAARVEDLRAQAHALLARIRSGESFAAVAASVADTGSGSDLGVRPQDNWPDLFLQATQGLQAGQVSEVVQSGNGFHILLVTTRGAPGQTAAQPASPPQAVLQDGSMPVTQTHARHILIKTSAVVSSEQAQVRVQQLAQRLQYGGEAFEDLARRYSQDATAPQGGDLGWLSPGTTVPPFEQAMDALLPGEVSPPVQTPFGWHLIQVLARRTRNMEDEYRRMQARQMLFQRRADPAYEDWLNRLRTQAFIDNRLDPQSQLVRR